jgi:Outer membrane protein beta-barrel domain/PDZ domain
MRHLVAVVFCLAVSSISSCQDSRADIYGGYSYVNIDTNGLTSRQNANGWEAAISGNFNKWFAVEGDVSGYYKSYATSNLVIPTTGCVYFGSCSATVKITDYSFAGGPRVNFKPVFIHALFGGDHLTGTLTASDVPSTSESQDGMAGLVGGGGQFKISGPWSVRASADYVFTRHNIFGGPSVTQNNYRAGIGVVYSFGARHPNQAPVRVTQTGAAPPGNAKPKPSDEAPPVVVSPVKATPPQSAPIATKTGVNIPSLGLVAILGSSTGAEIAEVMEHSAAALAGLHPGDVINAVDGKPVRTPTDLTAQLSNRSAGDKVRLGYMLHAAWRVEVVVQLGPTPK